LAPLGDWGIEGRENREKMDAWGARITRGKGGVQKGKNEKQKEQKRTKIGGMAANELGSRY